MEQRYPLLALAIGASSLSPAQFWDQHADFPSVVNAPYAFNIGERVFAGGGLSAASPLTGYAGFQEYIPSTDSWEARTPCPGPLRYGVPGFTLHGKGYVACGWGSNPAGQLTDLWEYDPQMDQWAQRAPFPGSGRYSCVSVATSSRAYLGLGYTGWLNDWWEYDASTDMWTQRASLPAQGRQACTAFVINDEVYVTVGARDVVYYTATLFTDLYRYSPSTDQWTQLASFPADGRVGAYGFSFGGVGYVFCGTTGDQNGHGILNDGWAYLPGADQWYQLGLFPGVPMSTGFACSTPSTCYIGLGVTTVDDVSWVSTDYTAAFWEYSPTGLVGLNELQGAEGLLVRQGPEGLLLQWPSEADAERFLLYDVSGQVVRTQALNGYSNQASCAVADLPAGLYVVHVSGKGYSGRVKVVLGS